VRDLLDPVTFGELLGLLAHDLRNPLSALHSNLGFLTSIVQHDKDALEAVSDGLVSCEGLAHIIDNIDLLGQSMRGVQSADGSRIDVQLLIAEVVSQARPMAESHNVRVVVKPYAGEPPQTEGPRELLGRAIANLVRNSIQHSPGGSSVQVTTRKDAAGVVVIVEDNGVSLPDPIRASVFTAMGQIGAKSAPAGRYSRGLGLLCAALAASAARAKVRVLAPPESTGNAFELRLPPVTVER
jgi:signal transduction histidine kinase